MSEMVERVINAIRGPIAGNAASYEDIARAAIEAMREPTEEMCEAAECAAIMWNAGIDAALK